MKRSIIALAALAGMAAHAAVGRHISLEEGDTPGVVRFISQAIELADGAKQSWVTITRTGDFSDPRYGDFKITPTHLDQMVSNFNSRVLGQDVFLDVAHRPSDGAAGKFVKLQIEGTRLRGLVEWTPFGMDAVKTRGFAYLSAEYHEQWKDNEKQMAHGCVLLGAGLTTRPVIKNLDPVTLSLDDSDHAPDVRVAISSQLLKELSEQSTMEKYLKMLSAFLATLGFTDVTGKPFNELLSLQLASVKDDDAKCLAAVESVKTLATSAMDQVKKLGGDPQAVVIQLAAPGAAPDVAGEVTRVLAARDAANAAATTALSAKVKLLSDTIAEGDKSLTPEGVKKFSDDFAPMITAVTTDEQVKHLASLAINQAKALSAAQKLAGLGYNPAAGNIQITVESGNQIKSLQATIDKRLGFEDLPDHQRYAKTGGKLLAGNKAFAEKALAQFDAANGHRLAEEHKMLAAGTGLISDVSVPVVAERTVLREALYNLVSLQFMDVGTAEMANVITIPYSYRDTTGAGVSALRRYEGQGIRRAGVIQTSEEARPLPQKLAFRLSNEMKLLMAASPINFDPVAENVRNIIRIVGEDTEAINMNELVRSSDESGVAAGNDTLTASVNGTNKVFVTSQFPVVKPRVVYDLKGTQVGSTLNPVVVTLNSVVRNEYVLPADGSALAAGTYYIMDWNLGELRFVTEAGVAVTPTNAWPLTVTYSYSTNVVKFDTDLGSTAVDVKYDLLLTAIGGRKAVIENDRYRTANMVLMSGAMDNALTQAKSFTASGARTATGLAADGSVGFTKGMPTFNPTAPGLLLNDNRIVVGERGNSRFRMVKAFAMNPMEQARDSNGLFIDEMEAFGTQYIVSHTPTQLKNSLTSVIAYSATGRVARA